RRRNRGLMTAQLAAFPPVSGFATVQYAICLKGIVWREGLRFLHQRERFVAALVRPLVWLSMVYDREMGNMRTLLVSPMPRWFLLSSKLVAGMAVSLPQVYTFLAIAWF